MFTTIESLFSFKIVVKRRRFDQPTTSFEDALWLKKSWPLSEPPESIAPYMFFFFDLHPHSLGLHG